MTRILFTGGGGAVYEALYPLWKSRYDMHFVDANVDAFSPALPRERCHVGPLGNDHRFAAATAELCATLGIDLLVPAVDEELPHSESIAKLAQSLAIMTPAPDYIKTMLDKLAMADLLRALGLPVPRTVTFERIAEIGFPCFAKPRQGRGSRGVQTLRNAEAAAAYRTLSGLADDQIVVQDLLEGQEYTVMMAADRDARLHAVVPVKVHVKRGITLRAQTDANQTVINACANIHRAAPTPGCYNIQLCLTGDNRVMPFEINPRISTTFCLGVAAGIDPIAIFLGSESPAGLRGFRTGVKLFRSWHSHIY
jgi:carbamoyl-phosphate synthase large subunit